MALLLAACGTTGPASSPDATGLASEVAGDTAASGAPEDTAQDTAEDTAADSGPEVTAPTGEVPQGTADLYGIWENVEGDVRRTFDFRPIDNTAQDLLGLSPVFRLYRAEGKASPVELQRGDYFFEAGPVLVTRPSAAQDPASVGKKSKATLLPSGPGTFALELPGGSARVYTKIADVPLPFP